MAPKPKLVVLHPVHGYAIKPTENIKVMKRNARERNRVQTVNNGFERLRVMVPTASCDKKMSKVNILGHAVEYIQCLHALIQQVNHSQSAAVSPHSPGVSSTSDYSSYSSDCSMYTPTYPQSMYPSSKHSSFNDFSPRTHFTPSQYSPHTPYTPSAYSPAPSSYSPNPSAYSPAPSTYSPALPSGGYSHFNFPATTTEMMYTGGSSVLPAVQQPASSGLVEDGESSEEDDLLDAIAEWQEHSS